MGIIRKTLMLSTGGLVRGSSKKQRVAKKQLSELKEQTRLAQQQADANGQQGSGYAPGTLGDRLHQRRQAKQAPPEPVSEAAPAPRTPVPPATAPRAPAGWYPAPKREGYQQYWDGARWTSAFDPPLP